MFARHLKTCYKWVPGVQSRREILIYRLVSQSLMRSLESFSQQDRPLSYVSFSTTTNDCTNYSDFMGLPWNSLYIFYVKTFFLKFVYVTTAVNKIHSFLIASDVRTKYNCYFLRNEKLTEAVKRIGVIGFRLFIISLIQKKMNLTVLSPKWGARQANKAVSPARTVTFSAGPTNWLRE